MSIGIKCLALCTAFTLDQYSLQATMEWYYGILCNFKVDLFSCTYGTRYSTLVTAITFDSFADFVAGREHVVENVVFYGVHTSKER